MGGHHAHRLEHASPRRAEDKPLPARRERRFRQPAPHQTLRRTPRRPPQRRQHTATPEPSEAPPSDRHCHPQSQSKGPSRSASTGRIGNIRRLDGRIAPPPAVALTESSGDRAPLVWHGVPPGGRDPFIIPLPERGEVAPTSEAPSPPRTSGTQTHPRRTLAKEARSKPATATAPAHASTAASPHSLDASAPSETSADPEAATESARCVTSPGTARPPHRAGFVVLSNAPSRALRPSVYALEEVARAPPDGTRHWLSTGQSAPRTRPDLRDPGMHERTRC